MIILLPEQCLCLCVVTLTAAGTMMPPIFECFAHSYQEKMNFTLMNQLKWVNYHQIVISLSLLWTYVWLMITWIVIITSNSIDKFLQEVEAGAESPGAEDFNHLCRVCGSLGPKVDISCFIVLTVTLCYCLMLAIADTEWHNDTQNEKWLINERLHLTFILLLSPLRLVEAAMWLAIAQKTIRH